MKIWSWRFGAILIIANLWCHIQVANAQLESLLAIPNDFDANGVPCRDLLPERTVSCPVFGVSVRESNRFLSQEEIEAKCASFGFSLCGENERLLPDGNCGRCDSTYPVEVFSDGNMHCADLLGNAYYFENPFNCGLEAATSPAVYHRPCFSEGNAPKSLIPKFYAGDNQFGELSMESCYAPPDESQRIYTVINQTVDRPDAFNFPVVRSYAEDIDHGFIQCPRHVELYDFATPWWKALYSFYGAGILWLCAYFYYRAASQKSNDKKVSSNYSPPMKKLSDIEQSKAIAGKVYQYGYKDSFFGSISFCVLILLLIGLFVFQLMLIFDEYGLTMPVCSEDKLTACGDNPEFTWRLGFGCATGCLFTWDWSTGYFDHWPYDRRPGGVETFYGILYISWTVFMICTLWVKIYEDSLPMWFRDSCSLKDASIVFCETHEWPGVKIEKDEKSTVVKIVRFAERVWINVFGKRSVKKACKVFTVNGVRCLDFQHIRYRWNNDSGLFEAASVKPEGSYIDLKNKATIGIDSSTASQYELIVGLNRIDVKVSSILESICDEFFQFFYIYQFGLLIIWFTTFYWLLGSCVLAVILAAGIVKLIVKRKAELQMMKLAERSEEVLVLRDNTWTLLLSDALVPGDVIKLTSRSLVVADCLLLRGRCVVNESILTGEPNPVPKVSIPYSKEHYDPSDLANQKYTLMSGTQIESVSHGAQHEIPIALVYATGANTEQGKLLRTILYPPPLIFKYDYHLKVVLAILYFVAFLFFIFVFFLMGFNYTSLIYGLFTISNVISPLIPAIFVSGQATAARNLQKKGIYCVNLYRTFVAAKVKFCCFDKTGTLTESGLDYKCIYTVSSTTKSMQRQEKVEKISPLARQLISCCHELDVVPVDSDEFKDAFRFVGNEIDTTMFRASQCFLQQIEGIPVVIDPLTGDRFKVLKRYEFERSTMTMSAVVENVTTKEKFVFTKGSFESVKKFSKAESIPVDFDDKCKELSSNGFYILGIAMKKFESHEDDLVSLNRKDVERDLEMMGLLVFSNSLKPDTGDAIQELKEGGVRSVMVTGDNILAASKIARDCGLSTTERLILGDMVNGVLRWEDYDSGLVIDDLNDVYEEMKQSDVELGVTGAAFEYLASIDDPLVPLYADIAPSEKKGLGIRSLVPFLRVLARMKPHQKVEAVRYNMEIAVTAMCGDGANDCAALRMSHCGLALGNSNQQATIVAPFNTASTSIRAMITLLIEGRAALATSNVGYKRLILYGQSVAMCKILIYGIGVTVGEGLWIIGDSIINCGLTFIILHTKATKKLSKERPTTRLFGAEITLSILFQLLVGALEYGLCYYLFYTEPEFQCKFFDANLADLARWWTMSDNFEGLAIGFVLIRQLICSGWVLNFGYKFREPWFKNSVLHLFIVALLVYLALILFWEGSFIACINRMNCGDASLLVWWNEELGRSVETGHGVAPPGCPCDTQIVYSPTCEAEYLNCSASSYNQVFHHNIIPSGFKWRLLGLLVGAFALSIIVEKVVMLGPVRSYLKKRKNAKKVHHVLLGHPNTSVLANMESKLHNARNL